MVQGFLLCWYSVLRQPTTEADWKTEVEVMQKANCNCSAQPMLIANKRSGHIRKPLCWLQLSYYLADHGCQQSSIRRLFFRNICVCSWARIRDFIILSDHFSFCSETDYSCIFVRTWITGLITSIFQLFNAFISLGICFSNSSLLLTPNFMFHGRISSSATSHSVVQNLQLRWGLVASVFVLYFIIMAVYQTIYSLWHRKEAQRTTKGRYLASAI